MLQNLLRKLLLQTPAAKEAAAAVPRARSPPQESGQVVLRPRRGRGRGRARVASCPVYLDQHRPQQPARRRCSSSLDLASRGHEEGESYVCMYVVELEKGPSKYHGEIIVKSLRTLG